MAKNESLNIMIAATFTSEPINEALLAFLSPWHPHVEFAPYNQLYAQLLNPSSEFRVSQAKKMILLRPEDWLRYSDGKENYKEVAQEFVEALVTFQEASNEKLLIAICPSLKNETVSQLNQAFTLLENALSVNSKVDFLNLSQLFGDNTALFDEAADQLGHIPYTNVGFTALAYPLARHLNMEGMTPRKVLALDCDNTIWKGVVGEDGVDGIEIRHSVTQFMINQMNNGKLLTLASKNEEKDVWQVFDQRNDTDIAREMIVHAEIHWDPKSGSLLKTAEALNVGADSFMFVDDNPIECAEVQASIPGVMVLNIPKSDENIDLLLANHWGFDQKKVTEEDRKRTDMMRQNLEREKLSASFDSFEAFLANIDLKIDVSLVDEADIERASQLTQRTNQFNSTTIRRTEDDIRKLISDGAYVHKTTVSDKFGSYGFVGLTISYKENDKMLCDSFMLSCRVLGKRVENKMVGAIAAVAESESVDCVAFAFNTSDRNTPLLKFYESLNDGEPLTAEGELVFSSTKLVEKIQSLTVDYGDVANKKKSKTGKAGEIVDLSSHYMAIAQCFGNADKLAQWVSGQQTKQRATDTELVEANSETEKLLVKVWTEELLLNTVGVKDNFFAIGGTSLFAAKIIVRLQKILNKTFPMNSFYEYPTIREYAAMIDGGDLVSKEFQFLTRLSSDVAEKPPLFFLPGMFGQLFNFRPLVGCFEGVLPCYGLQARGVDDGLSPFTTIDEMVEAYFQEIIKKQPTGPYLLLGYCSGGVLALDIAERLIKNGEEVAFLAMVDTRLPDQYYPEFSFEDRKFLHKKNIREKGLPYILYRIYERMNWEFKRLKQRLTGKDMRVTKNDLRAWPVADAYMEAVKQYKVKSVSLPVALYKVEDEILVNLDDGRVYNKAKEQVLFDNGWGAYLPRVDVNTVPGDHDSMLEEPNVKVLFEKLELQLKKVIG